MAAIGHKERKEISDAELWKTIPFDTQVEIDMAIDRGNKPEAIYHCMCSKKGFNLLTAQHFVERRAVELAKRRIPKKS
jgi:hypothetical protein